MHPACSARVRKTSLGNNGKENVDPNASKLSAGRKRDREETHEHYTTLHPGSPSSTMPYAGVCVSSPAAFSFSASHCSPNLHSAGGLAQEEACTSPSLFPVEERTPPQSASSEKETVRKQPRLSSWSTEATDTLLRFQEYTARFSFSVPQTPQGSIDTSHPWFESAAKFINSKIAVAYLLYGGGTVPYVTAKMVGYKLRDLGSKYDQTLQGWQKARDESHALQEASASGISKSEIECKTASAARLTLSKFIHAQHNLLESLGKIRQIQDLCECGRALKEFYDKWCRSGMLSQNTTAVEEEVCVSFHVRMPALCTRIFCCCSLMILRINVTQY